MTITGTCYYSSKAAAQKVYGPNLKAALDEGRIIIGKPEVKPDQRLRLNPEGRYLIVTEG